MYIPTRSITSKMILLCIVVLHLLCDLATSSSASECPVGCTCNERLVRCMRLQLTAIPEIPSNTNILDLRYNFIREIPANTFQGLSHLHTIFLNENQLKNVNSGAFHGLPSLKYLYLDKNRISYVSADAFQGLNHLDSLYLQYNSISDVSPQTFSNLPHLRKLMRQMKKKIKKLEHNCVNDKTKMHGHCIDDEGIKRLNFEIWSKDECTQCQCKHRQVNCMSEKCSQLYCGPKVEVVKRHGECCPHCDVNSVN